MRGATRYELALFTGGYIASRQDIGFVPLGWNLHPVEDLVVSADPRPSFAIPHGESPWIALLPKLIERLWPKPNHYPVAPAMNPIAADSKSPTLAPPHQPSSNLAFASAIDSLYVVPWSVMLASFRARNKDLNAEFFILHYDLTSDDRTYLKRVADAMAVQLHLIEIPAYPFAMFKTRRRDSLAARKTMSPIAYAKAFVDRFLPSALNRVVVIDADIVIAGSMAELETMRPIHSVAAVSNIPRHHQHQFNSGFMLIDLAAWRRMRIADRSEQFLFAYADALHSHDQHTLNLLIGNEWTRLHPRWNYMEDAHRFSDRLMSYTQEQVSEARASPVVIHFAVGSDKPWRRKCEHPQARLYLHFREQLRKLTAGLALADPQE